MQDHGKVNYVYKKDDGSRGEIELTLTQEPYLSGFQDDMYYEAHAIDSLERDYKVMWKIIRDFEDESDCDWDDYNIQPVYL